MTYRLAILAVIAVCTFAGSAVGTLRANQSDASAASVVTNLEPRWGTRACQLDKTCYTIWNWCVFLRHFNVGQVDDLGLSGLLRNWKLVCR